MKIKFNVNYGKIKYGDVVDATDIPNEEVERLIKLGAVTEVKEEASPNTEKAKTVTSDVPEVEASVVAKRKSRKSRAKKVE